MDRDERITHNLGMIEASARKLGSKPGARAWDDLVSAGQEALVKAADSFDAAKSPSGAQGFNPYAGQRIRWAMLEVFRKADEATSLDASASDEGEATIGSLVADRKADDPSDLAEVNEWVETNMAQRSVLRLSDCRTLTPKPEGVGAWAQKLREAAFNAVKEDDVTDLMKSLMDRAKAGDLGAAKLVLGYLTGGGAPRSSQVVMVQGVQIEGRHDRE